MGDTIVNNLFLQGTFTASVTAAIPAVVLTEMTWKCILPVRWPSFLRGYFAVLLCTSLQPISSDLYPPCHGIIVPSVP